MAKVKKKCFAKRDSPLQLHLRWYRAYTRQDSYRTLPKAEKDQIKLWHQRHVRQFKLEEDRLRHNPYYKDWDKWYKSKTYKQEKKTGPVPLSMDIDSSGMPIMRIHGRPSAQQERDFRLIKRLYARLVYGERSKAPWGTLSTKHVGSKKRTKTIHRYAYNEYKNQCSAYKDHWPPIPKKKIIANVQSSIVSKFGKKYAPSYVRRIVSPPPK